MLTELEQLARVAIISMPVRVGCNNYADCVLANDNKMVADCEREYSETSQRNAAYIAALVNAAPLLLAAVRAAEAVHNRIASGQIAVYGDSDVNALRDALAALKGRT